MNPHDRKPLLPTGDTTDMELIVGIDLGTTNSAVSIMKDGKPVIVPNFEGDPLTPSVVAFADDDRTWVGRIARSQAVANPLRTIFSVKRLMGRSDSLREQRSSATVVSSIKRHMGSDHVVTIDGHPYTPAEISGMILEKLKADAETYLAQSIERAVITVPAYFNDSQRRATREAAIIAGLEPVRLVNEPTAAALAYGLDLELKIEKTHTILVWDLGGGTFDVSLLELGGDGVFEVKAVNGNTHLGGDDYDHRLAEMLTERFRDQWHVDLSGDPSAERLMRQLAEEAKIRLSTETRTRVVLPHPFGRGTRCAVTVTREEFETITADITERLTGPARQVLADARLDPLDLDRVVLVGGMTRVPAVRRLVKQITGLDPYGHIDPDKVVALGAGVQAGVLAGEVRNVTLVDVTPLSLGIETKGGLFARIIERNTPVPATGSKLFTNSADDQIVMEIHVLQGEREMAEDNMPLGEFELTDITPQPRGEARVEVIFDIDANGMVQVSGTDLQTETSKRIRVEATDRPDQETVDRMVAESQKRMKSDQRKRKEVEVAIRAENLIIAAKQLTGDVEDDACNEAVRQAMENAEKAAAAVQAALADGRLEQIESSSQTLEASLKKLDTQIKAAKAAAADAEAREKAA